MLHTATDGALAIVAAKAEAKRFYISGLVQGVGFRFFAERVASRLGIAGYVRNLRDGRVEIYAIGPEGQLKALRAELERGPRAASISTVTEEPAEFVPRYAREFSIEFDAW